MMTLQLPQRIDQDGAPAWIEPSVYIVHACRDPEHPERWMWAVTVENTGMGMWAVRHNRMCLNRDGEWTWEPIPSERDEDFLREHRHTLDDALIRASHAAQDIEVNGYRPPITMT